MRNGEQRAIEMRAEGRLNKRIGLHVHGSSCFIHDEHACIAQHGARHAELASLSKGEVFSIVRHGFE